MAVIENRFRLDGLSFPLPGEVPFPSVDEAAPRALLASCPAHNQTPLVSLQALADEAGVAALHIKDERARMGLGSFKALGAAYVIAHDATQQGGDPAQALKGQTYTTASAGNHGMSVASGAAIFGANAVIYLAETVPQEFAARLEAKGAEVRYEGAIYEESMAACQEAAKSEGMRLLSDSSWDGYYDPPHRLMEGYLVLAAEMAEQIPEAPTHIFLQAGVGGMAGALAAYARKVWGDQPTIVCVEPEAAPALFESIRKGECVNAPGPVSNMGRLDCKEASLIGLKGMARDADYFQSISDELAARTAARLVDFDLMTTPSGCAGVAGFLAGDNQILGLNSSSRVLCMVSEQA